MRNHINSSKESVSTFLGTDITIFRYRFLGTDI